MCGVCLCVRGAGWGGVWWAFFLGACVGGGGGGRGRRRVGDNFLVAVFGRGRVQESRDYFLFAQIPKINYFTHIFYVNLTKSEFYEMNLIFITKTRLFKYIENFTAKKMNTFR